MSTLDPAGARAHLARRATTVQQSAVRDVFDIAMDPDLVSLAGGNPWLAGLPLEELGARAPRPCSTGRARAWSACAWRRARSWPRTGSRTPTRSSW